MVGRSRRVFDLRDTCADTNVTEQRRRTRDEKEFLSKLREKRKRFAAPGPPHGHGRARYAHGIVNTCSALRSRRAADDDGPWRIVSRPKIQTGTRFVSPWACFIGDGRTGPAGFFKKSCKTRFFFFFSNPSHSFCRGPRRGD